MKVTGRMMLENRLWKAQAGKCSICGGALLKEERFRDETGWNIDHVWPRSRYKWLGNLGNRMLAHIRCNTTKSDRDPNAQEIALLEHVNSVLGIETPARSHTDTITAPSKLAVRLQEGFDRWRLRDAEVA